MFIKLHTIADRFWNGRYFIPAVMALGLIGVVFGLNIAFMLTLAALVVFLLIFCDDLISIILPLMEIFLLAAKYFKDLTVLMDVLWYAIIPTAAAVLFHLMYYRKPFKGGRMLAPMLAVSAALLLGGVGSIPTGEYFMPISLYYVIGLGLLMTLFYCLAMGRLETERSYDRGEHLCKLLYAAGIFAAIVVFRFCLENLDRIIAKGGMVFYKPRNFLSSVMLMALPMACVYVKKNKLHLISMAVMYLGMVLTGSRSGLLFGSVMLLICGVYVYVTNKKDRWFYNILLLIVSVPIVIALVKFVPQFFSARLAEGGGFISADETRVKFIKLGISDFLQNPIFGVGMGNQKNIAIFPGIFPGCIVFYHNAVIQVFAALGLAGVGAYGWQLAKRVKLCLALRKTDYAVYGLSYLAILLMSLTNPGIFCPFPEAALLVVMFAIMEKELTNHKA